MLIYVTVNVLHSDVRPVHAETVQLDVTSFLMPVVVVESTGSACKSGRAIILELRGGSCPLQQGAADRTGDRKDQEKPPGALPLSQHHPTDD
ncbi:hypothetical protein [uncultured Pseudokineococcus sp.]|uniref:hypothetical protein n=1 Tax=uncultured Pseudokineococcus sp. TaxID=1642928 RepID=UPI00261707A4|nr:hypothetical protein [uncultured Pseudokineococcus sp.]